MKALQVYRSVPRYLAARTLGGRVPGVAGMAPVRLADTGAPDRPDGWVRLRTRLSGICGSDLATVSGSSSLYFSPLVSLPFTPGHEVLAETLDDSPGLAAGSRVVLDPLLGCLARGLQPCPSCADGDTGRCARVTLGHVSPGLQTGFCTDTGGGWSAELVAHPTQLHVVPDDLADERAVLAEPLACSVHVVRQAAVTPEESVLVVGAGSVGLLTTLALRSLTPAGPVTVVAKHARQTSLALDLGADVTARPDEALRAVRRTTGAVVLRPERGHDFLLGGVDVAIECTGTSAGLDLAVRATRAGGRVVLAGMPAGVDLSPVWFRELQLIGAYATSRDDFSTALRLLGDERLGGLVMSFHPLDRWREALDAAGAAGRLGVTKVGFDLRTGVAA
jgi:threonine dehydrogenase-like Zn-dependent dehydrogenase